MHIYLYRHKNNFIVDYILIFNISGVKMVKVSINLTIDKKLKDELDKMPKTFNISGKVNDFLWRKIKRDLILDKEEVIEQIFFIIHEIVAEFNCDYGDNDLERQKAKEIYELILKEINNC